MPRKSLSRQNQTIFNKWSPASEKNSLPSRTLRRRQTNKPTVTPSITGTIYFQNVKINTETHRNTAWTLDHNDFWEVEVISLRKSCIWTNGHPPSPLWNTQHFAVKAEVGFPQHLQNPHKFGILKSLPRKGRTRRCKLYVEFSNC